jgi:adenylosuccinate lyase
MPFGYSLLVIKSLIKGINNIHPNHKNMVDELENNPNIISEGLQTILRDIGCPNPYEILRTITQNTKNTELSDIKDKLYMNIHALWHEGLIEISENTISKIEELNTRNYLGEF